MYDTLRALRACPAAPRVAYQEKAFGDEGLKKLANYGYVQFFRSGEYHHNSPLLMKTLHKVRLRA